MKTVWLGLALGACSTPAPPPTSPPIVVQPTPETVTVEEPETRRPESAPIVTHTAADCPLDEATTTDVNGDGQPDIFEVRASGVVVCRASNLDFNGSVDVIDFYDDTGTITAKLRDFDGDGVPDETTLYRAGKKSQVDFDSDGDGVANVRRTYEASGCVEQRDDDGDGVIDAEAPC